MVALAVIGGGRMGEALVAGLLAAGWPAGDLAVVEPVADRRRVLAERYGGVAVETEPVAADGTVLAVKPADVVAVAASLPAAGRVLSIAAGVTLAALEAALPEATPVVRAMPNTAALVGAGAAAIAAGGSAGPDDLAWAESILGAVGSVVCVPESALDAVTGLSGSGPAFVFLVAEALVEAGVLAGLARETSVALAHQTVLGAGRLLTESGRSAAELRADVTSPGGTTAAGLAVLEQRAVRAAFLDAVTAAAARSAGLG